MRCRAPAMRGCASAVYHARVCEKRGDPKSRQLENSTSSMPFWNPARKSSSTYSGVGGTLEGVTDGTVTDAPVEHGAPVAMVLKDMDMVLKDMVEVCVADDICDFGRSVSDLQR